MVDRGGERRWGEERGGGTVGGSTDHHILIDTGSFSFLTFHVFVLEKLSTLYLRPEFQSLHADDEVVI